MAITEIYVDPSIAGDSGAGTIGDPFGDLEWAIEETDWDATNGIRTNIKVGTDEVVQVNNAISVAMANVASANKSIAWAPSVTAPAVFQGYTTTAGDGGIGGISGNNSHAIFFNHNYVHLRDLHIHNCNTNMPIRFATGCTIINCEVDNTTNRGIYITGAGFVSHCYVHDCGGAQIDVLTGVVQNCVVTNTGTKTCTTAINLAGTNAIAKNNIISVDSTSNGITAVAAWQAVDHNSIYSAAGSGSGILVTDTNALMLNVSNNLIEGFSGSGGYGIEIVGAGLTFAEYGANSIYNCETADTNPTVIPGVLSATLVPANETLSASPFTDPANLDMSPVDTGTVKEGSAPQSFWTV